MCGQWLHFFFVGYLSLQFGFVQNFEVALLKGSWQLKQTVVEKTLSFVSDLIEMPEAEKESMLQGATFDFGSFPHMLGAIPFFLG
jgi:hypothetical protein